MKTTNKQRRASRRAASRGSARIPPHEFRVLMRKTRDHYERTHEWVCTENTLKFLDDIGALRVPNVTNQTSSGAR